VSTLNSAEAKIRTLAAADATLQGIFGTGPFRWFFVREPQGYLSQGTVCRVRRVSAVYDYVQDGIICIEQVRLSFDCLDQSQESARDALSAVENFLGTIDLMSDNQFLSPPQPGAQFANFRLSERSAIEIQIKQQIYVWSADYRVFNNLLVS
jgi:hypothetical protein